jgi:hypothetical protein
MTFEGQVFLWVVIGVPLLAFMVYREVHPKQTKGANEDE